MAARETNPNFMNGVPELLILRLLQQEEMYGYEIVQAIRSRTDAVIAVGEGVVYPVLHGLEGDDRAAPVPILVRPSAVGDVLSRPPLPFGWDLLRCLCLLVVWLEDFSARGRYAFRQPNRPNVRVREYLFSGRQVILFRRAGSRRLGNRSHRRAAEIESGLAHCRFGPDRMDGCHLPNSRESNGSAGRTRAYQHELLHPWGLRSGYFRRPATCVGDFNAHGAGVYHLAITEGLLRLRRIAY